MNLPFCILSYLFFILFLLPDSILVLSLCSSVSLHLGQTVRAFEPTTFSFQMTSLIRLRYVLGDGSVIVFLLMVV